MKNFLMLAVLAGLMTAGCSLKFEQDPLAGQPDPIREGIPPQQKPDKPQPTEKVLVRGPQNASFMEDREDSLQFNVTVLEPGYKLEETFIANIDAFPGATFDPATGIMKWMPPKGTVFDGTYREMRLVIHSIATPSNPERPQLLGQTEVNVIVHRKMSLPEVKSVTNTSPNALVREGADTVLNVVIYDPDGGSDVEDGPSLLIFPPSVVNTKSLAPYTVVQVSSNDPIKKEWTYRVTIRLNNTEFTSGSDTAGFRLRAVNRFNQSSVDANFSTKVYTKLSNLNISWVETAELTPGQENVVPFLVFDEKGEAMIDVQLASTLPAGADIRCQAARPGVLSCALRWVPTGTASEQNFAWNLNATGRNADRSDTQTSTRMFTLRVKVKALPAPTPTPSPSPTPVKGSN